jgi:CHASE2 domain-containing sensor protein
MLNWGISFGGTAFDFWRIGNDSVGGAGVDGVLAGQRSGRRHGACRGRSMRTFQGNALIWALGAALFALIGVSVALSVGGQWYSVLSAVILLVAAAVFAAKAVVTVRSSRS